MKINKFIIVLGWFGTITLPLFNFLPALAASASMSLSLGGAPVKGNTISISVIENSGSEPVNAARATLSYPTDKLQYISISSSNSFSIVAASSGGAGSVNLDRGALPAVTGSKTVASVNFRVLNDSGTAALSITNGSVISANSNTDIAGGKSGTSFALRAPAAAPPPAAKDTTPPAITVITVPEITSVSAAVTWITSEPATSEISYGPTKSYGLAAVESAAITNHKLVLNSPLVQPGVTYHYSIKTTDGAGNSSTSPDATFTTLGAKLSLTVVDQKNNHLKGAKVEVDGQTATSDAQGKAELQGLTLGKKYGVINYHGDKYPFSADVTTADKELAATAKLTIKPNYTLPVIMVVIILLVLDYLIGRRAGRASLAKTSVNKVKDKLPFKTASPASPPAAGPSAAPGETIQPIKKN